MATSSLDTSTKNFILCLSLHCLRIRSSSINSSFASHFHSITFATQHRQFMEAIMLGTKLLRFQRILVYLPFHPFLPTLFLSSFLPSFCLPFSPFSSFFLLFFSKKYTYYTVFTFFFCYYSFRSRPSTSGSLGAPWKHWSQSSTVFPRSQCHLFRS